MAEDKTEEGQPQEAASEDEVVEGLDGAQTEGELPPKSSRKKFIIIGVVVILLAAILAALFLTPFGKKMIGLESEHKTEAKKEPEAEAEPKELFFVELPDVLVNLRSQNGRGGFLKISLVLEIGEHKDEEAIKNMKPRIIDQFQIFLRELDIEDIRGAAGLQRIRQELLTRVNAISHPIKVRNVLFKEFLMQ
jgi:flagellar protein FliL